MADGRSDELAVLVHEVRSPVAALAAISEAVVGQEIDDETRTALVRLALAACVGIARLVEDGTTTMRTEPVDPAALVADAVASARVGGAIVETTIAPDLPHVDVDPWRMRQALDNLLENAAIHGDGAGVLVSIARDDQVVRISVTDGGQGIPERDRERVFDAGIRLDDRTPGSGLGLAVARALVEGQGGRIELSSAPGGGATFTIELPITRAP